MCLRLKTMRSILVLMVMVLIGSGAAAQTDTPTPVLTISTSPHVFATTISGQMTRFDYTATAGSVHTANLLTFLFVSLWAMFLFVVFVVVKYQRSRA